MTTDATATRSAGSAGSAGSGLGPSLPEPPPWAVPVLRAARSGARVLAWTVLTVAALATLVPFLWMLGVAFRTPADLYADPSRLWPDHWSVSGFHAVFTQLPFARLAVNSIVFAGGTTVLLLLIDSLCSSSTVESTSSLLHRGREQVANRVGGALKIRIGLGRLRPRLAE